MIDLFLWYAEMKGNLSAFPKLLIQISYYVLIQNLLLCLCIYCWNGSRWWSNWIISLFQTVNVLKKLLNVGNFFKKLFKWMHVKFIIWNMFWQSNFKLPIQLKIYTMKIWYFKKQMIWFHVIICKMYILNNVLKLMYFYIIIPSQSE